MSEVNTGPDGTENNETTNTNGAVAETPDDASGTQLDGNTDKDTFPRSYVEELRKENADHRVKAKDAEAKSDELAKRLHQELVKATGRLENPDDLRFDAKHLDDAGELAAALDALLADRPYLAKRVVKGDAGQGNRGGTGGASWADLSRGIR